MAGAREHALTCPKHRGRREIRLVILMRRQEEGECADQLVLQAKPRYIKIGANLLCTSRPRQSTGGTGEPLCELEVRHQEQATLLADHCQSSNFLFWTHELATNAGVYDHRISRPGVPGGVKHIVRPVFLVSTRGCWLPFQRECFVDVLYTSSGPNPWRIPNFY